MANAVDVFIVPSSDIVPTSQMSELSPIQSSSKGKGRAAGERRPGPLSVIRKAHNQKATPRRIGTPSPEIVQASDQESPVQMSKGKTLARPAAFGSIFDPDSPASTILSLSSSSPVALGVGYRKRRVEHVAQSDDNDEPRTLKRLRRPNTPGSKVNQDVISLLSTDDEDNSDSRSIDSFPDVEDDSGSFIIDDGDMPSSPPPAVQDIREQIRGAIRELRKEPSAMEKSRAQMDALIAVMTESSDLVITMKTGGGKSMLWMVPHQLEEDAKSIVVCPFVALLNEQYENTTSFGLRCHKFSDHNVPDDVQVLFMQVEHCASERFTM